MSHTHRVLLVTTAAALLAFAVRASVSRGPSGRESLAEVRRAIEAGNAAWEKAFRTLDAAAVASTFDEEGINVGADGACAKGREAIEAAMRSYFERSGPATSTRVVVGDVFLDGDLAYEWGRSEFRFAPKPGGPAVRAGRYLTAWRRQAGGGWKILRNNGLPDRLPAVSAKG